MAQQNEENIKYDFSFNAQLDNEVMNSYMLFISFMFHLSLQKKGYEFITLTCMLYYIILLCDHFSWWINMCISIVIILSSNAEPGAYGPAH